MTTVPLQTIPVGQHVIVRLDGARAIPATVVGLEGAELTLVLATPLDPDARGIGVNLEWAAGLGFRRSPGEVVPTDEPSELIRVRLTDDPVLVHARRWPRAHASLGVTVALIDEPGTGGRTTTVNVGGGGILMNDPWRLRVGATLRVSIDLGDGSHRVTALGQVVREARIDQKGVRFDDITDVDRARLVRFVEDHERERVESGIFRF